MRSRSRPSLARGGRWARAAVILLAGVVALLDLPPSGAGEPASAGAEQVAVVSRDGEVEARVVSDRQRQAQEAGGAAGTVVRRGRTAGPELAESVPVVGAPSYWDLGHRGAGKVIAVIDTGVGDGGPGGATFDFGGTLVGQACFAATQQGPVLDGHCGKQRDVTEAFDSTCFDLGICAHGVDELDADAARPCDGSATPRACAHGTAVAAVAARHEPTPGVAPDAGVYAIQVFNPTGTSADFVDILLALDHVADLADAGMDVAAVNLSVATQAAYPLHCDAEPIADGDAIALAAAMQRLARQGVPTVAASGNGGETEGVAMPACVSTAVAVAASDLDDDMAGFSNRGPLVDLVAPGADDAFDDNGALDGLDIPVGPVTEWSGTSFAAPHVSGAFALVEQEYPKALPAHLLTHLRVTGAPVIDGSTGAIYPRLHLKPPAQALPAGVLFPASAAVAGTSRGRVGDFDGDGFDDVLAHAPGSAPDRISYGGPTWLPVPQTFGVGGTYMPIVGSFRRPAADDILWYAAGSAPDSLWVGSPARTFTKVAVSISGTYLPLVGDFDGDGFDDILWYAPGSARDSVWYGGPSGFTSRAASIVGTYRTAVGDVNGDGRDDVVFHGPGSTSDALWRGTATRGTWARSSLTMTGSYALRAGDFDGDDDDDLLLYQAGTGSDSIWRGGSTVGVSGGTGGFSPMPVTVTATFQPSVADLDGDARDDILWYAPGSAPDAVWFGQASGAPTSRPLAISGTYVPLFGDLDADAGEDIVWFQGSTPTTPVWFSHTG